MGWVDHIGLPASSSTESFIGYTPVSIGDAGLTQLGQPCLLWYDQHP